METAIAYIIVMLIMSPLWIPVLIAASPAIVLFFIGVRDSIPFLRSK